MLQGTRAAQGSLEDFTGESLASDESRQEIKRQRSYCVGRVEATHLSPDVGSPELSLPGGGSALS